MNLLKPISTLRLVDMLNASVCVREGLLVGMSIKGHDNE